MYKNARHATIIFFSILLFKEDEKDNGKMKRMFGSFIIIVIIIR